MGGYIRVSSVGKRDPDRFLSPGLQRDRISEWCAANGHDLVVVREDLNVSGGRRDRANLLELVERVERGDLGGIVVAALDRFGRSLVDAIALMDRIDKAGGQFVSVKDGFDTRTPYGRLALNILLSIAQFERERHSAQWAEARVKLIGQGRHHGGTPPFGYASVDGRLEPGEHADLARELFARRATGESPSALARWIADQGVRTGKGGIPRARWVNDTIGNRAYLGEVRSGDLRNETAHQPLVDRVTWERANAATGPRPARSQTPALLGGLVRCWACRYVMSAAQAKVAAGVKRSYRCSKHRGGGTCPAPAFALEEQLLPIVETAFFAELGQVRARAAGDTARLDHLRAQREQARHALTVYRDDPQIIDALGPDEYAEGLRVRRAAVDAAERDLAQEVAARPDGLPDAADLAMAWPEIDVTTKRAMLHALLDAVVVRAPTVHRSHSEPLPGRVRLLRTGSLPADVPRPGRSPGPLVPFADFGDPDGAWIAPS